MAHQNTEIASKQEDDSKPPYNILSMLPKIQLNLPFFNQKHKKLDSVNDNTKTAPDTGGAGETEKLTLKPNSVRFPDSTGPRIPPPLDFEAEEPVGRTSNPIVLWQVYALGGFLVLKWVWARWKERQERAAKEESSDDNEIPAPADDDDYHSA